MTYTSAVEFLPPPGPTAPSCLVLDIRMPGVDGLALQRVLNAEGSTIPTIIITADDDPVTRAAAQAAGAVRYLTKPFDDEALLDAIRDALDEPEPAE
jgi:FixJ family two-component response regulator